MGPNPKFVFQGFILLLGGVVFIGIAVYLKIARGKSLRAIFADCNWLLVFSFGSALILFIVVFFFLVWRST